MNIDIEEYKELLWNSQRCQRNWDLTKTIPQHDIDTMIHAVRSAPSKQNEPYYKVYGITDYEQRKKIYLGSENFAHDADGVSLCMNKDGTINYKCQSQLMGNFLFVFCRSKNNIYRSAESYSGGEFQQEDMNTSQAGTIDLSTDERKTNVQNMQTRYANHALGIGVGYLLITAHMLGYKTGCSNGFPHDAVKEITGTEHPEVIVAIGYNDDNRDRREEHFDKRLFPSFDKEIEFTLI